ncbi:helix-turn-helix transcriptional regulator [Microbacterium sp.]|uniref:helix-turn-helix domain-containing protein n=1 Tax=Microbacterium sp. TaxID=51671 RepID=UPI001AC5362F|nr:helix-turn-helix transcriptional regulator [Microbacterium sp.]MBN9156817.1 helix-turn-helix domain-containing protein [Microbacterium sp.]
MDDRGRDARAEVQDFLTSRRARLSPEQAGLPAYGRFRRVPGLRREEVALLAGVSVDYYIRIERGDLTRASDTVLAAIAGALQLDEAETAHLFDLARGSGRVTRPGLAAPVRVAALRPSVLRMIDAIVDAPAIVRGGGFDYLGANRLGRALYAPLFAHERPNSLLFAFLDPAARTFYREWDQVVQDLVATLHAEAGRHPADPALASIVDELSDCSDEFRTLWAAHNVRFHRTGIKRLHHPVVGDLDLTYEGLDLSADPGVMMAVYTAEPGSGSADALRMLASWAATDEEERLRARDL